MNHNKRQEFWGAIAWAIVITFVVTAAVMA